MYVEAPPGIGTEKLQSLTSMHLAAGLFAVVWANLPLLGKNYPSETQVFMRIEVTM